MRLPFRVYCLFSISALLVVFLGVSPLSAEQNVSISGTPYALQDSSARLIDHYNPQQMLRLVLALQPPHMADEEEFLRKLRDPNSLQFHKFLSEKEWNTRFAPSEQDEQAVVSWAQSQGLTITARYPNRLLVDVEAPVASIEKAFNVTINEYQVGTESRFSNDRDPSIPASLSHAIHAVLGLNNIEVAHAFSRTRNVEQRKSYPAYTSGPAYAVGSHLKGSASLEKLSQAGERKKTDPFFTEYGYEPRDIYGSSGYDYGALQNLGHCCNPLNNPNNSPPEASIAIAIWDDFADSDYAGFLAQYFNLAHNVQRYFVDGTPHCCGLEPTLDVEWATAMGNSFDSPADTAEIHMYEGADAQWSTMLDVVNRILTDGHARVLSMSWGGAELYNAPAGTMDSFHAVFNQLTGQGWALVAASGDNGSVTECTGNLYVSFPASDPNVTATGGTLLDLETYPVYEWAWTGATYPGACEQNNGGSGGGCSHHFSAPDYQRGIPGCNGLRILPDVALNAGEFQVLYYQGQWMQIGGTSIVAPEIAGFVAQENAYLLYLASVIGNTCGPSLSAPCAPMGAANPYIYSEARYQSAPHYPFYDTAEQCVINDINIQDNAPYYCAVAGFDQATGWGSINMLQFAWVINDFLAGDGGGPTASLTGPQTNFWTRMAGATVSWILADTTGNGHHATGVVGATALWDYDPGDPISEPAPGDIQLWNPFYGGPEYLGTTGSLSSDYNDGCHTLYLLAQDNTGRGSGDMQYGPVCWDLFPPYSLPSLHGVMQGQDYVGPVLVTFTPTDDASGVANTSYNVDGGPWHDYTPPLYVAAPGSHNVGYHSIDNVGNVEYTSYYPFTISSNSQFSLSVFKAGSGSGTVTSDIGGINCGSTCSANYYDEQPVTLTATPVLGSVLSGWSGCDYVAGSNCVLNVHNNRTAIAVFNPRVAARFLPVTPCRVVDTRGNNGPFGGPSIQGGTSRDFAIPNGPCSGIPANAAAYSLNVTVVPQGVLGYLTVFPAGYNRPLVSTINSYDGRIKATAAIVPAGDSGSISVYATQTTDVVLDIDGYFVPASGSALAFFPLTPCRVVDTRDDNGPLGGPYLHNQQTRGFPVLSSTCNIPASAQAYSMNFTAIPRYGASLGFLTAWPSGQQKPYVSTLNAPTGTVVANAAIVPAGQGGDLNVYPYGADTDLIIDIDGYFAPANSAPNPLSLYNVIPCRTLDTRKSNGYFLGELTAGVASGPCQVPSAAQAYVMTATVVPPFRLGYLTLWPDGQSQPEVSTLNAYDGSVTSNMAIVPTSNGSVDAYVSNQTQLILDISSYFAP